MFWELWDLDSKNLIETFDTEGEALQAAREFLAVNRAVTVETLGLSAGYDEGEQAESSLPPALVGAALQSRMDEVTAPPQMYDATRAVHGKIRRWLAEEGWHVRDVDDPQAVFNVMVILSSQQQVNIFQRKEHVDHITIALNITFVDTASTSSYDLPDRTRRDIHQTIGRDALVLGLEFEMLDLAPLQMLYSTVIYFDALTKNALVEKALLIQRVVSLAKLAVVQHAEAAGASPKIADAVVRQDNVRVFPASQAAAG